MKLYSGISEDFISDATHDKIADRLREAYAVNYRHEAPKSEVQSWRNSLRALSDVFAHAGFRGNGVLLEYELPLTSKRLDCVVTGVNGRAQHEAMVIELKQWETCEAGD